jgi:hypothetical protein
MMFMVVIWATGADPLRLLERTTSFSNSASVG